MKPGTNLPTLSGTMNELRKKGYTEDFNLKTDCLDCRGGAIRISPDDFQIDEYFRFEGPSDPADSSILYAISSQKHRLKGVLVNGYGIYTDPVTDAMAKKLKIA